METTLQSTIAQLREIFSDSTLPWLISALKEDHLVWDSLRSTDEIFETSHLADFIHNAEDCSPAALSLRALRYPKEISHLQNLPFEAVDEDFLEKQKPVLLDEDTSRLTSAGLQALILRQQRLSVGTWQDLYSKLINSSPTTLACLYGMTPDHHELLFTLIRDVPNIKNGDVFNKIIIPKLLHIIFSNPSDPDAQLNRLNSLCVELSAKQRLELIEGVYLKHPIIATKLNQHIRLNHSIDLNEDPKGLSEYLSNLSKLQSISKIMLLADQNQQESATIIKSLKQTRQIQAKLANQLAVSATINHDDKTATAAWEQAVQFDPDTPYILPSQLLYLLSREKVEDATQIMTQHIHNGFQSNVILLNLIRLIIDEKGSNANLATFEKRRRLHQQSNQALEMITNDFIINDGNGNDIYQQRAKSNLLYGLLSQFNCLKLWSQSAKSLSLLSEILPINPQILKLLAHNFHYAGEFEEAIHTTQLALVLDPSDKTIQRYLAESLMVTSRWSEALHYWDVMLKQQEKPESSDMLSMAACAIHAGQSNHSIQICEEIIEDDPKNGNAHAMLGYAVLSAGEEIEAQPYISKAIQLSREHPFPWLIFAAYQNQNKLETECYETLETAIQTIPISAELHLAFAEYLLTNNNLTLALSELRKADEIIYSLKDTVILPSFREVLRWGTNNSDNIAQYVPQLRQNADWLSTRLSINQLSNYISMKLGETLLSLGHTHEANKILSKAYLDFSPNTELAYLYARSLLKINEFEQALDPLNKVTNKNPPNPEPYLDHARCLIKLITNFNDDYDSNSISIEHPEYQDKSEIINQAILLLQRVIQLDPINAEAKTILAELHTKKGDYEKSLKLLDEAMHSKLYEQELWKNRIALNIYKSAIKINRADLAHAALLEADQNNYKIQESLAETYKSMDLFQEAFQAAKNSITQTPDDIDQIRWFSKFTQDLIENNTINFKEAITEIIGVLKNGVQLYPQRGDLWTLLGQTQLQVQQPDEARQSFLKLLSLNKDKQTIDASISDLYTSGQNLLNLGEAKAAVTCLEAALQTNITKGNEKHSTNQPSSLEVLNLLAQAYRKSGRIEPALHAFDQALAIAPHDIALHLARTDLILEIGSTKRDKKLNDNKNIPAITHLEQALQVNPDNPKLLLNLAQLNRYYGNFQQAMQYADRLVSILNEDISTDVVTVGEAIDKSISPYAARALAFSIAQGSLQDTRSNNYLDFETTSHLNWNQKYESTSSSDFLFPCILDYITYKAAFALERGDHQTAIEVLEPALQIYKDEPRILILQSQIDYRLGDNVSARELLNSAWHKVEGFYTTLDPVNPRLESLNSLGLLYKIQTSLMILANAAQEQHEWDIAYKCLEKISKLTLYEPYAYYAICSFIIQRAETQKLYSELKVIKRAPGIVAVEEKAVQQFWGAFERLKHLLEKFDNLEPTATTNLLTQLESRANAIFQPNEHNANFLFQQIATPNDLAAYFLCNQNNSGIKNNSDYPSEFLSHPLVQLTQAMIEKFNNITNALSILETIQAHYQIDHTKSNHNEKFSPMPENNILPLSLVLQAMLQQKQAPENGNIEAAQVAIEKALSYWPDEPEWHALAGEIYRSLSSNPKEPDLTNSISHYEQALALDPKKFEYALSLGKVLLDAKQNRQANQILQQAAELDPDNQEILFYLAVSNLELGQQKEADLCLQQLLKHNPQHHEALLMRADIALQQGSIEKSFKFAQAAQNINANDLRGLLILSQSMAAKGNITDALNILEKIPTQTDHAIPIYLERAKLIKQEKGVSEAVKTLNDVIEKYPNHPAPLTLLAEYQEEMGDLSQAQQTIQKALRIGHNNSSNNEFSEHAKLHTQIGRLKRIEGQLDQAIQHLTEAIHLEPKYIEPHIELGKVHLDRRQYNEALKIYQNVIQSVPESSQAYFHAGLVYKECKDYSNAEKMLRQAAKLSPKNLSIQRQLGAVVALNLVHNR